MSRPLSLTPIALALLLSLVPRLAPAQAPVQPVSAYGSNADLDRNIRFWEDMRHKIENLRYLYLPVPGAGAIISPEQEANLFTSAILTGKMSPDTAAILAEHRKLRVSTQVFLETVKLSLKELNDESWRRSQLPRDQLPNEFRGTVSGRWSVACWRSGVRLAEGGTFTLTLLGDGTVSGTYIGPSGSFGVGGKVDVAGNIEGGGTHPDGAFSYLARIRTTSYQAFLLGGTARFVPSDPEVTCAGGELSPTAPS